MFALNKVVVTAFPEFRKTGFPHPTQEYFGGNLS